jgi:hypothetical protein
MDEEKGIDMNEPHMICAVCRKALPMTGGFKALSVEGACITLNATRRSLVLCAADLARFRAIEANHRGLMMIKLESLPSSSGPAEVGDIVRGSIEASEQYMARQARTDKELCRCGEYNQVYLCPCCQKPVGCQRCCDGTCADCGEIADTKGGE